ncbi:hypothetical protein ACT8ZV_13075 [Nocardioides sp. MAHUQ-72]|uniref:hypothetical protein n=1 Tax=unclassified Nocardioides TaxID=2615069 RepID=UPI003613B054
MSTTDLHRALDADLSAVVPPPGDLARALREGRRIRRRRRATAVAGGVASVAAVAVLTVQLTGGQPLVGPHPGDPQPVAPLGRLDFSQGLRAYAAPGAEIHLGGRTFPGARLHFLDTDATATPYGVVFYDAGVPRLLDESGKVTDLERHADTGNFRPTAKVDAQGPLVAYGAVIGGRRTVTVRDLATDRVVARHAVGSDTVIDGLDDGVVLLRTSDGTTAWDTRTDEVRTLAGPRTRVADVRNGVLLYTGPAPDGEAAADYRLVPGAIDAQLTYDGRHVLYWSSRLAPTDGGRPIVLDRGDTGKGPAYGWWAIDTDGSVLTAVPDRGSRSTVYDCEVPSGRCVELGPLTTLHGDPMFIGVDM